MTHNPTNRISRSVRRKGELRGFLERLDMDGLLAWCAEARNPHSALISLMFDEDEAFRWRALGGLAALCRANADAGDLERVREVIRRLFWQMNDESGGLIWKAPEGIGEILARIPQLIDDYARILLSHVGQEPFERGVHWAAARMTEVAPEKLALMIDPLVRPSLDDPDPYIRAHAHLALIHIGLPAEPEKMNEARSDREPFDLYDFNEGRFKESCVADLIGSAIE